MLKGLLNIHCIFDREGDTYYIKDMYYITEKEICTAVRKCLEKQLGKSCKDNYLPVYYIIIRDLTYTCCNFISNDVYI